MSKAALIRGQDGSYLTEFLLGKGYEVHGIKRCESSFNTQAINNMVEMVLLYGKRFDCGSVKGYVDAIKNVASDYKFD